MRKLCLATTLTVLSVFAFSNISFAQDINSYLLSDNTQAVSGFHNNNDRPKIKDVLNLTPEQAQKAKEMRERSKSKIMPIVESLKTERQKLRQLKESNASQEEIKAQKDKVIALRKQAQQIREQNMKEFETILTPDQKVKFAKFKEERKVMMKNKFEERKKQGFNNN